MTAPSRQTFNRIISRDTPDDVIKKKKTALRHKFSVPWCIALQQWGYEITFRKVALLPNVAIRDFALQTPSGRTTVKKWKDVPFTVEHFNFSEYCRQRLKDS